MKYFILDKSKHDKFNFKNSPNNKDSVRWNLDETKFIVKFEEEKIPFGLSEGYTEEEIREIIYNPEEGWIDFDNLL